MGLNMTVSLAHDFRCVQTRDRQVARKKITWPPVMLSMNAHLLNRIRAEASRAAETSGPDLHFAISFPTFRLGKGAAHHSQNNICTATEQAALRFSAPQQNIGSVYHFLR
jgi:hypothetical protein